MTDETFWKDKSVILDTNILSQLAKEKRADKFRPVFDFFKNNNIDPLLIDATYFELLGFTANKSDFDFLAEWVKQFPILPTKSEDVELASLLSSYYKNLDPELNKKQISYCDCLHAAQLIKFGGRVFIVTTDIHDYPISIFDIKSIQIIEDNKKAVLVGFITFNKEKLEKARINFEKSIQEKRG
ncbi:MAG: hypothetical protein KGI50_00430 [Patescibacteria group bacterium]|nr:hypothetical protein [Patescibacteria group bacterium]MDE2438178.1 hypothetical protein [Patescibacteria group bacterium]